MDQNRRGNKNPRWKGGIAIHGDRVFVLSPGHPRANTKGYVAKAILVIEEFTGESVPSGVIIHHKNENPQDNHPDNLQICQNDQEHMILHQRIRALRACGHSDWRICRYCHKYDDPALIYINGHLAHHRTCDNLAHKNRREKFREEDNRYQRENYARRKAERMQNATGNA